MAELADAADSKSAGTEYLGGSIPPPGTIVNADLIWFCVPDAAIGPTGTNVISGCTDATAAPCFFRTASSSPVKAPLECNATLVFHSGAFQFTPRKKSCAVANYAASEGRGILPQGLDLSKHCSTGRDGAATVQTHEAVPALPARAVNPLFRYGCHIFAPRGGSSHRFREIRISYPE